MILYVTLGSSDFARSISFYDPVMATLGVSRAPDWTDDFIGWGGSYDTGPSIWLAKPFNRMPPSAGNGQMAALSADSAEQVQAFHTAALTNGGTDEGAPGTREAYGPHFYAAYVRDPDGNKLAAVFHHCRPA